MRSVLKHQEFVLPDVPTGQHNNPKRALETITKELNELKQKPLENVTCANFAVVRWRIDKGDNENGKTDLVDNGSDATGPWLAKFKFSFGSTTLGADRPAESSRDRCPPASSPSSSSGAGYLAGQVPLKEIIQGDTYTVHLRFNATYPCLPPFVLVETQVPHHPLLSRSDGQELPSIFYQHLQEDDDGNHNLRDVLSKAYDFLGNDISLFARDPSKKPEFESQRINDETWRAESFNLVDSILGPVLAAVPPWVKKSASLRVPAGAAKCELDDRVPEIFAFSPSRRP